MQANYHHSPFVVHLYMLSSRLIAFHSLVQQHRIAKVCKLLNSYNVNSVFVLFSSGLKFAGSSLALTVSDKKELKSGSPLDRNWLCRLWTLYIAFHGWQDDFWALVKLSNRIFWLIFITVYLFISFNNVCVCIRIIHSSFYCVLCRVMQYIKR